MVKEEVLVVKEEIITKENAVKAMVKTVVKTVVKAVAMNSIMKDDIMKKDMDSTVAHPIAIGTMC